MPVRRANAADRDALVALQRAAYTENERLLGAVPIPLQADYARILREMEVWLAGRDDDPDGALILEFRPDDMLIWSIATHPRVHGAGVGRMLLDLAERRAREQSRATIRLYTASVYASNIAWYRRHGFAVESEERYPDRIRVNMKKTISIQGETKWQAG